MRGTVLVVDDRARPRRALAAELGDAGFAVVEAADGAEGWKAFCRHSPDVVITDMVMPRSDGLELLGRIRSRSDVPVILFTARGSVQSAASAFKAGADDFVASPDVEVEELVELVASAMGERRPSRELPDLAKRLAGRGEAMTRIRERVAGLAPLWTPVLVSGEAGTGRDSVALAIHELGATAGQELLKIDAASFVPGDRIPATGAVYLDGVGSLTPEAQAHWADRVAKGEADGHRRGVRLLASTSDHLLSRVRDGSFNADLGTALLRFSIELAPLRDHPEDIPDVADSLVEKIGAAVGRKIRLSGAAREFISTRRWPGNASEMRQLLERAIAFSRGRQVRRKIVEEVFAELEQTLASIREQHSIRERAAVLRAIEQTGGNISHAAEVLGRSRSAVYRLIRKHGIALTRSS